MECDFVAFNKFMKGKIKHIFDKNKPMGKIIEGVWDCTYCGTDKIRGAIRKCPNCGRQRDDNIKFYIADPKNYVDTETAKTISRNPDWQCSYCEGLNSDNDNVCYNCGATREASMKNYFEIQKQKEEKKKEREIEKARKESYESLRNEPDVNKCDVEERIAEMETLAKDSEKRVQDVRKVMDDTSDWFEKTSMRYDEDYLEKSNYIKSASKAHVDFSLWKKIFGCVGIICGIALIIAGLIWLFSPKTYTVVAENFAWERAISVEEYKTVDESDWTLPPGGRLHYTQNEIRSYKQVIDHYETKTRTYTEQVLDHYEEVVTGQRDLGNGYFEEITSSRPVYRTETKTETYQEPVYRQEPVYDIKYYYEIDKWVYDFSSTSNGNDKEPYWNEVELEDKHRESGRSENYEITVYNAKKDKRNTYEFSYEEWCEIEPNEEIQIEVTLGNWAQLVKE